MCRDRPINNFRRRDEIEGASHSRTVHRPQDQRERKSQKEIAEACGCRSRTSSRCLNRGTASCRSTRSARLRRFRCEPVYCLAHDAGIHARYPRSHRGRHRGVMLTRHERDIIETYRDLTHGIDEDVEIRVGGDEGHAKRGGVRSCIEGSQASRARSLSRQSRVRRASPGHTRLIPPCAAPRRPRLTTHRTLVLV